MNIDGAKSTLWTDKDTGEWDMEFKLPTFWGRLKLAWMMLTTKQLTFYSGPDVVVEEWDEVAP